MDLEKIILSGKIQIYKDKQYMFMKQKETIAFFIKSDRPQQQKQEKCSQEDCYILANTDSPLEGFHGFLVFVFLDSGSSSFEHLSKLSIAGILQLHIVSQNPQTNSIKGGYKRLIN